MMDYTCETNLSTNAIKSASTNEEPTCDKAVNMLLAKLDEGTQTVVNLRSILTLKTAELNELLAQLELTHQAITSVEMTTSQIETMLKDLGLNNDKKLIIDAEASLDSAIKSATTIYTQQLSKSRRPPSSASSHDTLEKRTSYNTKSFTSKIRYKPDTKHILRKLNDLLRDLELDSGKFFAGIGTTDDFEVLQKAYVDLDIAKTIALSAKSNMKRRAILLRSSRRRNNREEIQVLGDKIREGVSLWMTYTRNSPLLINNGEDIISVLDREDTLIAKNLPVHTSRISYDGGSTSSSGRATITPSNSGQTNNSNNRNSTIATATGTSGTVGNSTSTHSNESIRSGRHSRTPSAVVDSFIPLAVTTPPLPTTITNTNTNTTTLNNATLKKQARHSVGTRLTQVKASVGLPRVRTSSLTTTGGQQQQQSSKTVTPPSSANTRITAASLKYNNTSNITSSKPPIRQQQQQQQKEKDTTSSSSSSTTTSNNANAAVPVDANKKSQLKPPTQRGPGSTLRLRSMLAKKKQMTGTTSTNL